VAAAMLPGAAGWRLLALSVAGTAAVAGCGLA
jgi:hypothetical protein